MRTHTILALCAVAALAASGAVTGSLTLENGEVQKGTMRWSAREKAYVLTKGKIEQQFKAAEIAW